MHHEFFVSIIFNRYIANPIAEVFGFHTGHDVLPAHLVMIILISLGLILFALGLGRYLSVDSPGAVQQSLELGSEALMDFMKNLVGPNYKHFFPIIVSWPTCT